MLPMPARRGGLLVSAAAGQEAARSATRAEIPLSPLPGTAELCGPASAGAVESPPLALRWRGSRQHQRVWSSSRGGDSLEHFALAVALSSPCVCGLQADAAAVARGCTPFDRDVFHACLQCHASLPQGEVSVGLCGGETANFSHSRGICSGVHVSPSLSEQS